MSGCYHIGSAQCLCVCHTNAMMGGPCWCDCNKKTNFVDSACQCETRVKILEEMNNAKAQQIDDLTRVLSVLNKEMYELIHAEGKLADFEKRLAKMERYKTYQVENSKRMSDILNEFNAFTRPIPIKQRIALLIRWLFKK